MTTADDVLNGARSWLGTTEQPRGSNNVPGITDWYGLRGAWCAMFVSRVFYDAGMPLPASTPKGFAWVSAGFDWFRSQGWHMFTDWREAQPGDLIAWEWGTTAGGYDHISIVEGQGPFTTIGGNERDTVKLEFFGAPGGAALFARPPYAVPAEPVPDVPPSPIEEPDVYAYSIAGHEARGQLWLLYGPKDQTPIYKKYLATPSDVAIALSLYGAKDIGNQGALIDFIPGDTPGDPTVFTADEVAAKVAELVPGADEVAQATVKAIAARLGS